MKKLFINNLREKICDIGKNPGLFIAGGLTTIAGFLLGIAFILFIK